MTKHALLIGCNDYQDPELSSLEAPSQDITQLAKILRSKYVGKFNVVTLKNPTYSRVKETIEETFKKKYKREDDLVLLYFACHGIKDEEGNLHLAMKNTSREKINSTGISCGFIDKMIHSCKTKKKLTLLDCCYSGAFSKGIRYRSQKKVDLNSIFQKEEGQITITATNSMQYAMEGKITQEFETTSYFTSALINGLKSGKADINRDGKITANELFEFIEKEVKSQTPNQTPELYCDKQTGEFVIIDGLKSDNTNLQKIKSSLTEARNYYEEENYEKAKITLKKILKKDSDEFSALDLMSKILIETKEYKNALKFCEKALQIKPEQYLEKRKKTIKNRLNRSTSNSFEQKTKEDVSNQTSESNIEISEKNPSSNIIELTDFKNAENKIPNYTLLNLAIVNDVCICIVPIFYSSDELNEFLVNLRLKEDKIQEILSLNDKKDLTYEIRKLLVKHSIEELLAASNKNYIIPKNNIIKIKMGSKMRRWFLANPISIETTLGKFEFQISFESEKGIKKRYDEIRKLLFDLADQKLT